MERERETEKEKGGEPIKIPIAYKVNDMGVSKLYQESRYNGDFSI